MVRFFLYFSLGVVLLMYACNRTDDTAHEKINAPFLELNTTWADSMLNALSLDEKIGQLIFLETSPQDKHLFYKINQYHTGGIIADGFDLATYIHLLDSIQRLRRLPLLNGTTQNIAINNQFSDALNFPKAISMAAVENDKAKDKISARFIQSLKALNIHFLKGLELQQKTENNTFNFDVLAGTKTQFTEENAKMLQRIQRHNVLGFAEHFKDFVLVENDTIGYLDSLHNHSINLTVNGLSGMIIDPSIFKIDTLMKLPRFFLEAYLEEHLKFKGLLLGDVKDEASIPAMYHTGIDIFISKEPKAVFNFYKKSINKKAISEYDLNQKVKKVLLAKKWVGLDTLPPRVDSLQAFDFVHRTSDKLLIQQLNEASVIALNTKKLLPFSYTYQRDLRLIHIGDEPPKVFEQQFKKYADYTLFKKIKPKEGDIPALNLAQLKQANTTIISLANINLNPFKHAGFLQSIQDLQKETKVLFINYGNPENLFHLDTALAKLQVFEQNEYTEQALAQILFGGIGTTGKMPLAIKDKIEEGSGDRLKPIRLKYTIPEEVGISSESLKKIDSLANRVLYLGGTPGCQVLVAKEGKVIYNKAFGFHTYAKKRRVKTTDVYDIASITKIAATTMMGMKLYEQKKYKVNDQLSKHYPVSDSSKINKIPIKNLYTHQSNLQVNMPIWRYMKPDTLPYCFNKAMTDSLTEVCTFKVADNFYLNPKYLDTLWRDIDQIEPYKKNKYRYSDVNFNILYRLFEIKSEKRIDAYVNEEFYQPLGLRKLGYQPLNRFDRKMIIPTEKDEKWRRQLVHGYPHDETASLLGGVAGNAGLFSNAEDLAVIGQLWLNKGEYGGKRYLEEQTINFFTASKHGNHRGLGFDKQKPVTGNYSCAKSASMSAYGHSGFTGGCMWIDPKEKLVFVYLSNRIHPTIFNRVQQKNKIRRKMHQVIYDAITDKKTTDTPRL